MSIMRKNDDARRIGTGHATPLLERFDWVSATLEAVRREDEIVRLIGYGSKVRRFTDNGEARLTFLVIFERFAFRGRPVYRGTLAVVAVVHARRMAINRKHAVIMK